MLLLFRCASLYILSAFLSFTGTTLHSLRAIYSLEPVLNSILSAMGHKWKRNGACCLTITKIKEVFGVALFIYVKP